MKRGMNRLAGEKSLYLRQHAQNPVDWYPWGPEAFARAAEDDKPVFLSIGYSSCHWCHVMERESFEDEAVAALLNASFVAVKVGREVVVVGRPESEETKALLAAVRTVYDPGRVLLLKPDGPRGRSLVRLAPFVEGMKTAGGLAAAYICSNYSCRAPLTNPNEVVEELSG
jgi:uncharacterized protein YyaL (SSP411 family)